MASYTFSCTACSTQRTMTYGHGGRRTTCDDVCARAMMRRRTQEWRLTKKAAATAGRKCPCGRLVPTAAHALAKYCSKTCEKRDRAARLAAKRRAAPGKRRVYGPRGQVCTCPDCETVFVGPLKGPARAVRLCAACSLARERAAAKAYAEREPDKVRARKKQWREANPEYLTAWLAANPERARDIATRASQRRRHLVRTSQPSESFEYAEIFERDGWICGLCGASVDSAIKWPDDASPTLDHVTPLSRGGTHTRANVQLAHWSCNRIKGARASA